MSGVIYACFALFVAPMILAAGVFGSASLAAEQPLHGFHRNCGGDHRVIFYGVTGFVCGVIGGLLCNLFARTVGGLELEQGT